MNPKHPHSRLAGMAVGNMSLAQEIRLSAIKVTKSAAGSVPKEMLSVARKILPSKYVKMASGDLKGVPMTNRIA